MNNSNQALSQTVETAAVSALAAASKTPFKTAFMVTMGLGLARLLLFLGGLAGIASIILIYRAYL